HYLKGKKSGEWQFFNEKGELESTETNEGDLTVRTFYYQGKVYRIEQYKDALLVDTQIIDASLFEAYKKSHTDGATK
ncbi:MAG: hypothetical protein ACFB10_20110, partial [Salibacteraceae bacterium]